MVKLPFVEEPSYVAFYRIEPSIRVPYKEIGIVGEITSVDIVEYPDGMFDLFDQDGCCLNLGVSFPFLPTKEEVIEFLKTDKIKGKIE